MSNSGDTYLFLNYLIQVIPYVILSLQKLGDKIDKNKKFKSIFSGDLQKLDSLLSEIIGIVLRILIMSFIGLKADKRELRKLDSKLQEFVTTIIKLKEKCYLMKNWLKKS